MKKFIKKYESFIISTVLIVMVFAVCFDFYRSSVNKPEYVSYDQFQLDLTSGKIDTVYYSADEEYMRYTLLNDETSSMTLEERLKYDGYDVSDWRMTMYPAYEDFRKELMQYNVNVVVRSFSTSLLSVIISAVPLIFVVYLFGAMLLMVKRASGIGNISEDDLIQTSKVKFSDVVGQDEVIEDVRFIVNLMKNPKLGESTGARVPKGVLFSGEPGTGKTLLAKAIAGEAGVPFIYMNASSFIEMYVGLGAKRVRELFKVARKNKPCIIFIDEIDAIGGKRTSKDSNSENNQTLNALLQEMDGFNPSEGIIVIGATNIPEKLDKALLRAGRFDRKIVINPPKDWRVRKKLFEHYLKDKPVSDTVDLEVLSKQLTGFTGADIESIVNESALIAAMSNEKSISNDNIEEAIDKVVFKGNRSKENEVCKDKEIVAYHEAGHAVMSYLLGINIARASIISSTSGVGGAVFNQESDSQFMTNVDFKNQIKVCYGGRASEDIKFGIVTTGASNDITQATNLIQKYVQRYGFDGDFGLLDTSVLERYMDTDKIMSKFSDISKELYKDTVNLLKENYNLVEILAHKLLEMETLTGDSIKEILDAGRDNQ